MAGGIRVTVDEVWGSAPREAGAAMWVNEDRCHGTIGGGALEWRAISHARALLAGELDGPLTLDLPLGPALAQCCGGRVRLSFLRDETGRLPEPVLARVHLYGLGHVGSALAAALAPLPLSLACYDSRPSMLDTLRGGKPGMHDGYDAFASPGDFHIVMTHDHALDLEIVTRLMRSGDFGWLGLIGSATKRARFERALRAEGLDRAMIDRLVCPIGVMGIKGKSPTVIAASVAAQLLIAAEAYSAMGRNRQVVTAPE